MDKQTKKKLKHKYIDANKHERKKYIKKLYQTPVQEDNRNDLIPVHVIRIPNKYSHSYYYYFNYRDTKLKEKQLSNIHSANARRKHAPYAKARTLKYTDDMLHPKQVITCGTTVYNIFKKLGY